LAMTLISNPGGTVILSFVGGSALLAQAIEGNTAQVNRLK
jgi:hypothetical protein